MTSTGPETATTAVANRIIVGVDGSESSKQALRWAGFLARTTGDPIEAVLVVPVVPTYAWTGAFWGAVPGEADPYAVAEKVLTATVDSVYGAERPEGIELTVLRGGAAEALVALSRSARIVVVGSRGHGGFAGLLLGSVSSAVAEHATCPVLVVHGQDIPA